MSYSTFTKAVKSTIDFYALQLAVSKGLPFIDLASERFSTDVLESDQPAVCWEFASISEDPMDPLWLVMFDIGVMTALDPSQYESLDYVSMFIDTFKAGKSFIVCDYSLAPDEENLPVEAGSLFIVSSGVTPQQADRVSGLRFVTVTARASRKV